jgi:hypothetical protein
VADNGVRFDPIRNETKFVSRYESAPAPGTSPAYK